MKVIVAHGEAMIVEQKVIEETASGIVIPEIAQQMSMQCYEGEILAVGPDVKKFKKGDHVLFGKHMAAKIVRGQKEFCVIYERDIFFSEKEVSTSYEVLNSELAYTEN